MKGEKKEKDKKDKNSSRIDWLNTSADILCRLCLKKCRELKKNSSSGKDEIKNLKEASTVVKEVIAISKSLDDGQNAQSCVKVVLEDPFYDLSQ